MAIILQSEYYFHATPERMTELVDTINHNLSNPLIDEVHLVHLPNEAKDSRILSSDNLHWVQVTERPTYQYFFRRVNEIFKPGNIYLTSNLDIYFDESLSKLAGLNWESTVACLSRWNLQGYCGTPNKRPLSQAAIQWNHKDSHDTWIACAPFNQNLLSKANFTLGVPGCDGKIAYYLQECGYHTINPAELVRSYHQHLTGGYLGHRTYSVSDRLPPPYGQVPLTRH